MDSLTEAIEYDAMNFTEASTDLAKSAIALGLPEQSIILDAGISPGRILVLIYQMRPKWQIIAIDHFG